MRCALAAVAGPWLLAAAAELPVASIGSTMIASRSSIASGTL